MQHKSKCPNCSSPEYTMGERCQCGYLNTLIPSPIKLCPHCKFTIPRAAKACGHCGRSLAGSSWGLILVLVVLGFVNLAITPVLGFVCFGGAFLLLLKQMVER